MSVTQDYKENNSETPAVGDALESFVSAKRFDAKGREIGYTVGLSDNGVDFYAWVQSSRKVGREFADFGVRQRSRKFDSQQAASSWAYRVAHERIASMGAA